MSYITGNYFIRLDYYSEQLPRLVMKNADRQIKLVQAA